MPPAIAAAVHARITAVAPDLDPLARRSLEVLTPERWTIEWRLPEWLARAFSIDERTAEELVLANVLGLVAIRAEDDLGDGEIAPGDVAATRRLATVAMDEALSVYRGLFPVTSPVWDVLSGSLAEWRAGAGGRTPRAAGHRSGSPATPAASWRTGSTPGRRSVAASMTPSRRWSCTTSSATGRRTSRQAGGMPSWPGLARRPRTRSTATAIAQPC